MYNADKTTVVRNLDDDDDDNGNGEVMAEAGGKKSRHEGVQVSGFRFLYGY